MPDYKVITAEKVKSITNDKGEFQTIALTLDVEGQIRGAEWFAKATTPIPTAGSFITGTLENDPKWGWKFKKAQAGGGFGGGPRPEDPKRQAMIVRQHSQTAAVSLLDLMTRLGVVKVESKADAFQAYVGIVDWLDTDAKKAGGAA